MLVPMTKVRLLGARREVERVVDELHQLGLVEIADARASLAGEELGGDEERARRRERLRRLAAQTDGLLSLIAGDATRRDAAQDPLGRPLDLVALEAEVKPILSGVEASGNRLSGALRDERLELPRFLEPLRRLLPLVPELADLDDEELGALGLDTVALVLNTDDEQLVLALREQLVEELGARFELVWTRVGAGGVGCLVVFPQQERRAVHALLGHAQVREAGLPEAFQRLSLRAAVEAMQRRLAALPDSSSASNASAKRDCARMARGSASCTRAIADELERLDALDRFAATKRTFVAECWVPRRGLARLRREVEARLGNAVLVEDLATSRSDPQAPLLMRNVRAARPFEPLVRLPRAAARGLGRSDAADGALPADDARRDGR